MEEGDDSLNTSSREFKKRKTEYSVFDSLLVISYLGRERQRESERIRELERIRERQREAERGRESENQREAERGRENQRESES